MVLSTVNLLHQWVEIGHEDICLDKKITEELYALIGDLSSISPQAKEIVIKLMEFVTKKVRHSLGMSLLT